MAKEKTMSAVLETKTVVRAMGAALARAGHNVPQSTLLNAFSAAVNRRDWHKLKAALAQSSQRCLSSEITAVAVTRQEVPATLRTDDKVITVKFDAQNYLQSLSGYALHTIWQEGYAAFGTRHSMEKELLPFFEAPELAQTVQYLTDINSKPNSKSKEERFTKFADGEIGFDIEFEEEPFMLWMEKNRTYQLANLLCEVHDIDIYQAEDSSWRWKDEKGGTECDKSFMSQESASVSAYYTCNLLGLEMGR